LLNLPFAEPNSSRLQHILQVSEEKIQLTYKQQKA
jgi:hypothetical protein